MLRSALLVLLVVAFLVLSCTNNDPYPPSEYKGIVRSLETLKVVPGIPLRLDVFSLSGDGGRNLISTALYTMDTMSGVDGSFQFSVPGMYKEAGTLVRVVDMADSLISGDDRYQPCLGGLRFYPTIPQGALHVDTAANLYVDAPTYLEITATREPSSTNRLFLANNTCSEVLVIESDSVVVFEKFYTTTKSNGGFFSYNIGHTDGGQEYFSITGLAFEKRDTTKIQISF